MRSIKDFSKSVLGSWVTQSLIENITEGAGWVSGQIGGSYIGNAIGQVAFAKVGSIVGVPMSMIGGYAAGAFFEEDEKTTVKSMAVTAITTVGLTYVIPPLMEAAFGSIGGVVGGGVGALTFGTIGAYAGIKLVGSKEKLFDFENQFNNYTTKTAISLGLNSLIGVRNGGVCYLDAFIVNQAISSVSFHAIEWMEFSSGLSRGHMLDGCFPRRMVSLLTSDNGMIKDFLSDIGAQELHGYIEFISADPAVAALSSGLKAEHIKGNIIATKRYERLNDILAAASRDETNLTLPMALQSLLGWHPVIALAGKSGFIRDDAGCWYVEFDRNLLNALSVVVHNKFQSLEKYAVGCEFSGAVELDIIREFVSAHASNFCMFALSNLVDKGRDAAYTDSAKIEACNKELYKSLNHIVFGYYQITMPSLFRGKTLDTVIEVVDEQIDGSKGR